MNYLSLDVATLLDIVVEIQPLGSNMWSLVEKTYNQWAVNVGRPERDAESLKLKFDKLANTKKSTGDPSCPADVRRAKRVGRDLLASAQAGVLGGEHSGNDEGVCNDEDGDRRNGGCDRTESRGDENSTEVSNLETPGRLAVSGARKRKRNYGAGGLSVAGNMEDDPLLKCVRTVAQNMCDMTDAFLKQDTEDLLKMVKEEVEKAAKDTKESIQELKSFIQKMLE